MMRVSVLLAMAENGVIGRSYQPDHKGLPWRLPADLRHFQRLTVGHTIVMGRKTFESIGRPLPRRRSIVITRDRGYRTDAADDRVTIVHTFDEALHAAGGEEEVLVVGGAEVFALAWPHADRLYLTRVHAEVDGDVRLPELDLEGWELVETDRHEADERHAHAFSFERWERRPLIADGGRRSADAS